MMSETPRGVATFSASVPEVSYWFPRGRQGVALEMHGGVGNMTPRLFTLILPFAIGALGLVGADLGWLALLVFAAVVYALFAVDFSYFQLRAEGLPAEEGRITRS